MKNDTRDKNELTITRVFNAPRELVWEYWTRPERLALWWAAKGVTSPVYKVDLRVGGKYLYCMRLPDGKDVWGTGVYREIREPERLVMTDSFADPAGNVVPATYYGMESGFPMELLITVTFEEAGGKTKMTLKHAGIPEGRMAEMTRDGWNESFDKLAKNLKDAWPQDARGKTRFTAEPGKPEIVGTRIFDAPREAVYKTSMDPRLIPRWWGPKNLSTTVEKMEVRPGGKWRFIQRDPDGNEYAFNGEYREVIPPELIVLTFEYEGMPGSVSVETTEFAEYGGKTRVTQTMVFGSAEDRDGAIASDMESGWAESDDRFEALLKSERASAVKKVSKEVAPARRRRRAQ